MSKYHDALPSGTEINNTNRHIWLAMRHDITFPFLGASEWGAAIGVAKYGTPLQTYARLIGEGEPVQENALMRRGHYLQPWCLKEYELATGDWVSPPHGRHEVFFWGPVLHGVHTGATLDAISAANYNIEAKSHGWRVKAAYGEGDDEVPLEYYTQCHAGMGLADLWESRLVAAFDGEAEPRIYPIPFKPSDYQSIVAKVDEFCWTVQRRTPPPYQAPEDEPLLKRLYKWDQSAKTLPDDLGFLLADTHPLFVRKKALDAESRELEKTITVCKGRIKSFLAGATFGQWHGWQCEVKIGERHEKAREARVTSVAYFDIMAPVTVDTNEDPPDGYSELTATAAPAAGAPEG
jgi:hypothetical protein